jgi:ribosome maturation factor RimP
LFFKITIRRALKVRKYSHRKKTGFRGQRGSPVNEQTVAHRAMTLAQPLCESIGLEVIHVEFQRESRGRILRLYIDKPGGINLNDCADVSRQLGDILDVNLDEIGPYHLEVTSPGADRPLAQKQDFEKFKGSRVKIKTNQPVNRQKNFNGILLGMSGEQVNLQIDEQTIAIPYQDISKARLAS